MKHLFLLMALVFGVSAHSAPTTYDELASAFATAAQPLESTVMGYWGGNCSTAGEPEAYWPGVLVVKEITKPGGGKANTLSYFWERKTGRNIFRAMTPDEVENYDSVKEWFAKEQWNPISVVNASLANDYTSSSTQKTRRELRWEENEFNSRALMRVVRVAGAVETTLLYCEFDKYLGKMAAAPAPRDPSFVFGYTGSVWNSAVIVNNSDRTRDIERLQFLNRGGNTVFLRDIIIRFDNGSVGYGPTSIQLPFKMGFELKRNATSSKRIDKIEFSVTGSTSNIEIKAFETP
jgi:hypothetical protein